MRLRQVALAARELAAAERRMEEVGLRAPFRDPGVAEFGLVNVVYAVGDTFLEVVVPDRPDTAAGRWLDHVGADLTGYMALVQVDDLAGVRKRADDLGIRSVWSVDLDDIAATHLHPKDVGAIVSVDQPADPSSWRWAGRGWQERAVPGGLKAVELGRGADPSRWGALLDRPVEGGVLPLDDGTELRFVDGEGVVAVELVVDDRVVRLPG
jgi:hypothetical protein